MPKYGIHEIVLNKAVEGLAGSSDANVRNVHSNIMANKPYANLGAIGPDLFFWGADYEAADKLFKLYKNIEKIKEIFDQVLAPISAVKEAVGEATEAVVGTLAPNTLQLVKSALERVRDTATLFKTTVASGLFTGVLNISDYFAEAFKLPLASAELFDLFSPPLYAQLKNGEVPNVKNWYWFDMLHYRRTGTFSQNLLNLSRSGTNEQKAYAYGYLSHIATDLTGHGFVNEIVGGPYRMNVQRHATVENYLDCWAFSKYHGGENISEKLVETLNLPQPDQLSGSIIQLLDNCFRKTYSDLFPTRLRNPGFYTQDEIARCYEFFYTVLTGLEGTKVDPPEEPFSGVADILNNALNDLLEPPPSPPPAPSSACSWSDIFSFGLTQSSRDCYEEFFEQAAQWVEYLAELALWTFETMLDLVDLLMSLLLSLPITVLLAILYGIQMLLYSVYQNIRTTLAQFGFIYPSQEELSSSVGLTLSTTLLSCASPFKYPFMRDNRFSHLLCPGAGIETPATAPDFYGSSPPAEASGFIENLPFDPVALKEYAQSTSPQNTRELHRNGRRIGNAKDLCQWMITAAATQSPENKAICFTDWNLDSDRGYAYKIWTGRLNAVDNHMAPEMFGE
ncbi:MAG: zinc dependent phospholipase C family protein [Spirochaetales bacterium]|nr:zinc dependent phospholipase C family protein [Spirochaetales bacterium]